MPKSDVVLLKTISWAAVAAFTGAVACYGYGLSKILNPPMPSLCGDPISDLLGILLSIGSPAAMIGTTILAMLWIRGFASVYSASIAALLSTSCTGGLVIFALTYCQSSLPGFRISQVVWWM